MIIGFYDENFKGITNNTTLSAQKDNFKLIKRPIDVDSFSCICEKYTANIQPTFISVENDLGEQIYSCFAGIPLVNSENKTEINGTDLKTIFSSDAILEPSTYTYVYEYINYLFNQWNTQVNQDQFTVELNYKVYTTTTTIQSIAIGDLKPSTDKAVYNVWNELKSYLKYYNLYIVSNIDLVNKKLVFTIGKTQVENMNIRLWDYGIVNYSKYIADVNECQGYYNNNGNWTAGSKWIMTSSGSITTNANNRDIYPIKRRVFVSEESLQDADTQALTELLNNLYNENINIEQDVVESEQIDIQPNFETNFIVYANEGDSTPYKQLPVGELTYNYNNELISFQIGYRFTGVEFIW